MTNAVTPRNVTKSFGETVAVRSFDLSIPEGALYGLIAAIMAAVGSAVSELRDAQSLMMPVMLCLMLPWFLMAPIARDPNSMLSVVLSFIPPISNFVMLLRMASNTPPALWQVWLSVLIGAAGVYVALRFAAKVFRVGLLMFGKPPTFGTLVRWARMS